MKPFQVQTHYEVLEVSVGATTEEIRRAWDRLTRLYSEEQVALYGLVDAARADMLRLRLKQALDVLTDEEQRDAYDMSIGLPPRDRPGAGPASKPAPSAPRPEKVISTGGWGQGFSWVTPAPSAPAAEARAQVYEVSVSAPLPPPRGAWSEPPPVPEASGAEVPTPGPAKEVATSPGAASVEASPAAAAPTPADSAPEVEATGARVVTEQPGRVEPSADGAGAPADRLAPPSASGSPVTAAAAAEESTGSPAALPEGSAATAPPAAVIVGGAERSGAPTGRREPTEAGSEAPPVAAAEPAVERPAPEVSPQRSEPAPGLSPSTPASGDAPRAGTLSEESQPRADDGSESAIVPARSAPAREYRPEPRPRPYEVPAGVEINGDLLRQVRMARGLSLLQVSERTRIGTRHLENVEADRYEALPAPVYLRGILMSLARELGLDGLRVSRGYLAFVEARRTKG